MIREALLTLLALGSIGFAQVGDVVHVVDPSLIRQGDTIYLFSTGRGIQMRTSNDLVNWKRIGTVFTDLPDWVHQLHPKTRDCWAPDISFNHGEYRLYYAVSELGSRESSIGLVTNITLDPNDPKYRWTDRGPIVTTHETGNWNAIDPAAFTDANGQSWLAAGSWWTGIKLFKLDAATGKIVDGDQPRAIATRGGDHSIEGAFLTRRGDWYYLWTSFDRCGEGVKSTYNIRVARGKSVEGPFFDADGTPTLKGGGTLVLGTHDDVHGPGHCAVFHDGDADYLVHHWYDAAHDGRTTLGIEPLTWDAAGWPHAGAMLSAATQPASP